ncbi:unnamed protein product [Rhizopus stolonifer]
MLLSRSRVISHCPRLLNIRHVQAANIPLKKKQRNPAWLSSSTALTQIDPTTTESTLPSILALNELVLTGIHEAGFPWWLTIPGQNIELAPMIQSWAETLKTQLGKDSKGQGWTYKEYQDQLQREYKKKVRAIYAQYGCSRWKLLLLPYIQIPLFVSMSLTLRHITAYPLPWYGQTAQFPAQDLDIGGLGFFTDLTATDSTMILPILVGAGNLINVELNAWFAKGIQTRQQKIITNLLRALSIAFIPIAANAPSAISLYWVTSSWYSVIQNLAFKVPAVRSKLKMPPLLQAPK